MNVKETFVVVDVECASEFALTEEIVERDSCSYGNARSELLPAVAPIIQSIDEMLDIV